MRVWNITLNSGGSIPVEADNAGDAFYAGLEYIGADTPGLIITAVTEACDHDYSQLIERGYERYWSAKVGQYGAVAAFDDSYSENGDGSAVLRCWKCQHEKPVTGEIFWN